MAEQIILPAGALNRRVSSRYSGREEVVQRRLDLTERGLDQREENADARLTISQEQLLLERSKQVEAMALKRFALEHERRVTIQSAMLIEKLGKLNPEDKNFAKDWSTALSQHSDALENKGVLQVMEAQRQRWTQFTSAQDALSKQREEDAARKALESQKETAAAPGTKATAALNLSTALKNLDAIAQQFETNGVAIPPELQAFKSSVTKNGAALFGEPAVPAAPVAPVVPSAAASVAPVPAAPAPSPTPTPAPAPSVSPVDFLRKALGTTPAATPAASPVAAVQSGLPDAANAALSPDEEKIV